jgi:flagellar hook assembly protein FlgD
VQLAIYDASGRRVRTLESRDRAAGRGEVLWDGTDDNGIAVPAGAYFCRLSADGQVATMRVQRIHSPER